MGKKIKKSKSIFDNKILKSIDAILQKINVNPFFTGIIILILNVFSKFVVIELSPNQKIFIKNNLARQVIIFSFLWMGTRNLYISFTMTAVFFILTDFILNENSNFCIIPEKYKKINKLLDKNKDGIIQESEIDRAIDILNKAKVQSKLLKNKTIST